MLYIWLCINSIVVIQYAYMQLSLNHRAFHKLVAKFYVPYQVLEITVRLLNYLILLMMALLNIMALSILTLKWKVPTVPSNEDECALKLRVLPFHCL